MLTKCSYRPVYARYAHGGARFLIDGSLEQKRREINGYHSNSTANGGKSANSGFGGETACNATLWARATQLRARTTQLCARAQSNFVRARNATLTALATKICARAQRNSVTQCNFVRAPRATICAQYGRLFLCFTVFWGKTRPFQRGNPDNSYPYG